MHTIGMLDLGLDLAKRLGYSVREEWLGTDNGGGCVIRGKKTFFLNLALGASEQLQILLETLQNDPDALAIPMPAELSELLTVRRCA